MRILVSVLIGLCFTGVVACPALGNLTLVQNGASDYCIVVPDEATPVETTAAGELRDYLQKATGAELGIFTEKDAPGDKKQLLVGATAKTKRLLEPGLLDDLGYDGIVLKTAGDDVILAGHPVRGALYAVYTFLEDVAGVRWWTSSEETVPRVAALKVGPLDKVYAPRIRIRESFYRDMYNGIFAARNKCNGNSNRAPAEYGGHERFAMFVHTFFPLLPPSKYFAEHPEWYSLIGEERRHERAQLCLTNGAMREELTKNALAVLRNDPNAAIISISQNDWYGNCQCEKCKAVEEEEGSPAGLMLRFVNRVAEDIEKEFPDVFVETLAYQYTRKPPKHARPRDNVIVRLCSIECCFSQPLATGDHNVAFREDMEGWSEIAKKLYVWDYVTNFSSYMSPHPNLRVLAPNIRFFEKNNVVGLFEQGDYHGNVGDFIRLRAWLLAKLMWDSSQDPEKLIDEFLTGYYGPAAPHLREYLDVINDAGDASGIHLGCFMSRTHSYLRAEDLEKGAAAFDKAVEAVKDDPVLATRVDRAKMSLDYVLLLRHKELERVAKAAGKEPFVPQNPKAAAEAFVARAEKYNLDRHAEHTPFSAYKDSFLRRFRDPAPVPEMCKDLPESAWVDINDNEMHIVHQGRWGDIVDDPKASDGKAVRMPGDHYEWATSFPVEDGMFPKGPWRCYVVARCEATAEDGPAMTMGLYDSKEKKGVAHKQVDVGAATGDYHVYDLGTHELRSGMYFWMAPPKRPGEVQAVYVDRIFLIKE